MAHHILDFAGEVIASFVLAAHRDQCLHMWQERFPYAEFSTLDDAEV